MDKPYAVTILKKSQATEPALAACFDQAAIFARFNTIAAQKSVHFKLQCSKGTFCYMSPHSYTRFSRLIMLSCCEMPAYCLTKWKYYFKLLKSSNS
ncbi:hypothetical protein T08_7168 [Trichinella sp. T8]|nr:hypothetical protein T08_7168 [Trichinella sp. T8]